MALSYVIQILGNFVKLLVVLWQYKQSNQSKLMLMRAATSASARSLRAQVLWNAVSSSFCLLLSAEVEQLNRYHLRTVRIRGGISDSCALFGSLAAPVLSHWSPDVTSWSCSQFH